VQMLVDRVEMDDLPVVGRPCRASYDVLAAKKETVTGTAAPPGQTTNFFGVPILTTTVTVTSPPAVDWVGTDETGYESVQLKARIMCLGQGAEWWAMMDGQWLSDADGGPLAFPSARMAREQVELRRKTLGNS
jgi:hypothetical protein